MIAFESVASPHYIRVLALRKVLLKKDVTSCTTLGPKNTRNDTSTAWQCQPEGALFHKHGHRPTPSITSVDLLNFSKFIE